MFGTTSEHLIRSVTLKKVAVVIKGKSKAKAKMLDKEEVVISSDEEASP
jgi:hypothetical protein